MKIFRDIIEVTLRNHGIDYSDEQLDEMVQRAASNGTATVSADEAIERIGFAINVTLNGAN